MRNQVNTLAARLAEPPNRLVAVFGPRQTGKTTLTRQSLECIEREGLYISVDEPEFSGSLSPPSIAGTTLLSPPRHRSAEWLIFCWEAARQQAARSEKGLVLVLDEIQKIPNWSETIKGLWDADRAAGTRLHVVLLGSAPLLMQSGLVESLAGRFELIPVTHWSFPEMQTAFGLDLPQYIYFGGYPGSSDLVQDNERWRQYILRGLVEPNIERDILSMVRIEKPVLLKNLFELGAAFSGQILSYNKMLGQLQDAGNTTTLARYLDLLSQAGLIVGFQKYSPRLLSRRGSSPKLNVLNTSLMTAGSGYSFPEAQADRTFWGRLVESAVGAHLYNTASADLQIFYWREQSFEMDFVLRRGSRIIGIEVKTGTRRWNEASRSEFEKRFEPEQCLLVGDEGIPLNEFLSVPAGHWFEER